MKISKYITRTVFCLGCLLASGQAAAEGPWVYGAGTGTVGVGYVNDHYDEIWMGDNKTSFPEVKQQNLWLYYDRGLSDQLMMSVQLGYTQTSFEPAGTVDNEGMADTSVAVKYQWLNEFTDNSSVSLSGKIRAILKGTYDRATPGNPQAPGDKSNGLEAAVQLGRFVTNQIALFGELGYRAMTQQVPDALFYNVGANAELNERVSVNAQYAVMKSQDGLDIGGSGYGGEKDLHRVKEEREWLEFGVSFAVGDRSSIGAGVAEVLDGQNTGKSSIWNVNYTYSL